MLSILAFCITSCSNDYEQWDYDYEEKDTWETELRNIISDYDFLLENSFVRFVQAEEINGKVDFADFFNNETFYPVCVKKLHNFFMLKKLGFIMNDTNTVHTPTSFIKGVVTNILDNRDKYDVVKLTWQYCGDFFNTMAVFDKQNGEIVYDNVLTNIPLSNVEVPSGKSKLTRAEGSAGVMRKIFYWDIMDARVGPDIYSVWVKCICNIKQRNDGFYSEFVSIHKKEVFAPDLSPNNPNTHHNYPVADACVSDDAILYYVWVGDGEDTFNYATGSESQRLYACYDIWDIYSDPNRPIPNNTVLEAAHENLLLPMGNYELYMDDPSPLLDWNFY